MTIPRWSSLARPVRVALLAAGGAAALGAVLVAYVAVRVRSLDTPAFQKALLDRVSAALGTRVQARSLSVSLLRGVTAEGVTIANPPPFNGTLLSAERLTLRYRPLALLRGRLELAALSVEKPVLDLAMDARGAFAYERLSAARTKPSPGASLPVALAISKLSMDGARLVMRDPRRPFVIVEGTSLDSGVRLDGGTLEGEGTLRVGLLNLADGFFVRDVRSPLAAADGRLKLDPVRATLAGGTVRGTAEVRLQKGFGYTATLRLDGARLETLLAEAKAAQALSGRLAGEAAVAGSGGVATLTGKGQLQVDDCRATRVALLTTLAAVLQLPELAHPEFDECRATFTLGGGRLTNPTLALKGPSVQLTGRGSTSLTTWAVDYDLTLALGRSLAGRIPVAELRDAFRDRGDGFVTIDFAVTGTTTAPRTDLPLRVGKAAAESGLKRFLRKKFF